MIETQPLTKYLTTERLIIDPMCEEDTPFIYELVNTKGWITYIGDRNVHSLEDALSYIQKINSNTNYIYMVCRLKEDQTPIGVVTLIKRERLDHYDIGFAFLPQFEKHGYAYEASQHVLNDIIERGLDTKILAITERDNENSIALIHKLGLEYVNQMIEDDEELLVFAKSFN